MRHKTKLQHALISSHLAVVLIPILAFGIITFYISNSIVLTQIKEQDANEETDSLNVNGDINIHNYLYSLKATDYKNYTLSLNHMTLASPIVMTMTIFMNNPTTSTN